MSAEKTPEDAALVERTRERNIGMPKLKAVRWGYHESKRKPNKTPCHASNGSKEILFFSTNPPLLHPEHHKLPEALSPAAVKVVKCHMGVPMTYSSMSIEKSGWLVAS